MNRTIDKRINLCNKLYPIYDGLSKDLLFYIAIDTLFLTVAKGFSAFEISFLGVVPTLICIAMQPVLVRLIKIVGNVNSSKIGTFALLVSSIIITFGSNFWIIAIGQLIYDIAFVLKNMESIVLKNNLNYQGQPNKYFGIRGRSNTIYATVTFLIAIIAGPLFNISPYLPMYLCIFFCIITCFLSLSFYEVEPSEGVEVKDIKKKNGKLNKVLILGLLSNTLFLGIVVIGQQDSKLFIQYQLTNWYGIQLTATYLGFIIASSRVARILLNILFNKYYLKFQKNMSIILSTILAVAFTLIIIGAIIPAYTIIKVLIMTLGFDLIIPMRDTFIIYMEDLFLKNSKKSQQQALFTNMELLRKFGKVLMNLVISLLVLKIDLLYIMVLFLILTVVEIVVSIKIIKFRKV